MVSIWDFTVEETQIVAIFCEPVKESRVSTMKRIIRNYDIMDDDVKVVADSALEKLSRMSDSDFMKTEFVYEEAL